MQRVSKIFAHVTQTKSELAGRICCSCLHSFMFSRSLPAQEKVQPATQIRAKHIWDISSAVIVKERKFSKVRFFLRVSKKKLTFKKNEKQIFINYGVELIINNLKNVLLPQMYFTVSAPIEWVKRWNSLHVTPTNEIYLIDLHDKQTVERKRIR